MWNAKRIAKIMVISLVFLSFFLYIDRSEIIGYDSYYFLDYVCDNQTTHFTPDEIGFGFQKAFFSLFPCDFLFIKSCLFACFLLSFYIIFKIAEFLKKGTGYLTLLFLGIVPVWIPNFFKFENDVFAFPLVFLSLYFFIKFKKRDYFFGVPIHDSFRFWNLFLSLFLLLVACLFWGGAIYLLVGYAFSFTPLLLVLAIVLVFFFEKFFTGLFGNILVLENNLFNGVWYFLMFFLWQKKGMVVSFFDKSLFLCLLIIALVNPKFFILVLPLLAFNLAKFFVNSDKKTRLGLLCFGFVLNLFWILAISLLWVTPYPPISIETEAVQDLIDLGVEKDKETINDWSLGHLVWFYGGETRFHSGYGLDVNAGKENKIVLTRKNLKNCEKIKQYQKTLLGKNLTLYNC